MRIRTLAAMALFVGLFAGTAFAGGEGWTDNFEAARKQAKEEGKDLLIDFTGSDW